jgi:hypothetical protein
MPDKRIPVCPCNPPVGFPLAELALRVLGRTRGAARVDYIPPENDAAGFRLQLHLTILEMIDACLALFSANIYSPIPILIRVMYEALADQVRLARNPAYADQMLKTTIEEGRNLPKLLNQHGFDMLKGFLQGQGTREFLARLKRESKAREKKEATAEDKFIAADMENEYTVHRLLSGHVHNDAAALQGRHATKQPDGSVRYEVFKVPGDAELCAQLGFAAGLLLRSCAAMHPGVEAIRAYSLSWRRYCGKTGSGGPTYMTSVATRMNPATQPPPNGRSWVSADSP